MNGLGYKCSYRSKRLPWLSLSWYYIHYVLLLLPAWKVTYRSNYLHMVIFCGWYYTQLQSRLPLLVPVSFDSSWFWKWRIVPIIYTWLSSLADTIHNHVLRLPLLVLRLPRLFWFKSDVSFQCCSSGYLFSTTVTILMPYLADASTCVQGVTIWENIANAVVSDWEYLLAWADCKSPALPHMRLCALTGSPILTHWWSFSRKPICTPLVLWVVAWKKCSVPMSHTFNAFDAYWRGYTFYYSSALSMAASTHRVTHCSYTANGMFILKCVTAALGCVECSFSKVFFQYKRFECI